MSARGLDWLLHSIYAVTIPAVFFFSFLSFLFFSLYCSSMIAQLVLQLRSLTTAQAKPRPSPGIKCQRRLSRECGTRNARRSVCDRSVEYFDESILVDGGRDRSEFVDG